MAGCGRVGRRAWVLAGVLALAAGGLVGWLATPAAAITVSDETGLRLAFGDAAETQIDLANDITLSVCTSNFGEVTRSSDTALTLDGHGFTVTQTCPTAGVFGQNGGASITFQNITITGGNQDNTTTCFGGGIRASAPVTVINSTVRDNFAACAGGGISVGSSLTVTSSTVSGNTSGEGGGIFQSAGPPGAFTLTNSTVTGNTATEGLPGGGIRAFGDMTMVYSTVAGNTGADGANLSGYDGGPATLTSFGSVVALAQGGGTDCAGFVSTTSNGFNWDDDGSCGFGEASDHSDAGDPQLGALADNGGPTQTRLPQPGSGLIDAIASASCEDDGASGITTDQRGLPRPALDGCDIGAVEVQPTPPGPSPGPSPGPNGPGAPGAARPVAAVARFTG